MKKKRYTYLESKMYLYCVCINTKKVPKNNEINSDVERPLCEQSKVFGAQIKIMWEWKLVDPLIHIKTANFR